MEINFSDSEIDFINSVMAKDETIEGVVHRLILPMVKEHGEDRLQTLANIYRSLTPDQQVKALSVLQTWVVTDTTASKVPTPIVIPTPV